MTFINFIVILKLITNEYEIGEKMNRLSSIKNKKENNKNKPKIKISRLFKLLSLLILIIISKRDKGNLHLYHVMNPYEF